MTSNLGISAGSLHALSKILSNAGIQRIMLDENFRSSGNQIKRLLKKSGVSLDQKCTLGEMIEYAHAHLLKNYRHEYLYKAALLNDYILKNHSLVDSILLNEFRVGQSKADAVLVNGTNKVFEIKTELDNPGRLASQINDYYKAFSEVFLIVHHTHYEKYLSLIDEGVGLMLFNDNSIEIARPAVPDNSNLDTITMMKALRKNEFLVVVKALSGELPNVKPILLFKSCLEILRQFAPDEVQAEFLSVIKGRINLFVSDVVTSAKLPESLKLSLYYSNINRNEYISLVKRLDYQF
ncbi:hypothetical protein SAMN05216327_117126 [Dyadobacter sp. SG02]|uniref:sce7726 family protein n=1 Tax=Dyadobacter sp. SG02 TaxID=1855291 RepID=UPI0008D2457D|nr:sce7726 family protein [Dyadobacter sp. SG02]SEJ72993.1 hypothetical protein SAMN05216327_117126 [Dyadobacter sp. SG02]